MVGTFGLGDVDIGVVLMMLQGVHMLSRATLIGVFSLMLQRWLPRPVPCVSRMDLDPTCGYSLQPSDRLVGGSADSVLQYAREAVGDLREEVSQTRMSTEGYQHYQS